MKKLKLLIPYASPEFTVQPGQIALFEDEIADQLIENKMAKLVGVVKPSSKKVELPKPKEPDKIDEWPKKIDGKKGYYLLPNDVEVKGKANADNAYQLYLEEQQAESLLDDVTITQTDDDDA